MQEWGKSLWCLESKMAALISNRNLALGFFILSTSSILLYKQLTKKSKKRRTSKQKISFYDGEYFPPLPDVVVEVMRTSKLCYLATQADGNPHLSLMNFTYSRPDEVIILSTRSALYHCRPISSLIIDRSLISSLRQMLVLKCHVPRLYWESPGQNYMINYITPLNRCYSLYDKMNWWILSYH